VVKISNENSQPGQTFAIAGMIETDNHFYNYVGFHHPKEAELTLYDILSNLSLSIFAPIHCEIESISINDHKYAYWLKQPLKKRKLNNKNSRPVINWQFHYKLQSMQLAKLEAVVKARDNDITALHSKCNELQSLNKQVLQKQEQDINMNRRNVIETEIDDRNKSNSNNNQNKMKVKTYIGKGNRYRPQCHPNPKHSWKKSKKLNIGKRKGNRRTPECHPSECNHSCPKHLPFSIYLKKLRAEKSKKMVQLMISNDK